MAHDENTHDDQQQNGEPGEEHAGKEGRLFTRLDRFLNAVLDQFRHHPEVARRCQAVWTAGVRRYVNGIALDIDLIDAPRLRIGHELSVGNRLSRCAAPIELLKYGRSEVRRVGKECVSQCRSRLYLYQYTKKTKHKTK